MKIEGEIVSYVDDIVLLFKAKNWNTVFRIAELGPTCTFTHAIALNKIHNKQYKNHRIVNIF